MRTRTLNFIAYTFAIPVFMGVAVGAFAQATTPLYDPPPENAGFQLPHVAGSLRYALTASETIGVGGNRAGAAHRTYLSGNAGYISNSTRHPFSLIYSTGISIGSNSQSSRVFQDLAFSQGLTLKHWNFLVTDSLNFLPSTPVSGLSGVAGVGDVGSGPFQSGNPSGDGVQSNSSTRLANSASGSISRSLTGRTSLSLSGSFTTLRFPGSNVGLQYNRGSGTLALSHVLSARSTVSGSYFYSKTSFGTYNITTASQGANLSLSRQWSARLTSDVSGGPVFIQTTGRAGRTSVNYSASVAFASGLNSYGLSASRHVNTGSGVTLSTQATDVSGSFSRKLGQFTHASARASYTHSTVLPSAISASYTVSGVNGSIQLARSLSRTLSAYASYTVRHQDLASNVLAVNALQGTQQTIGFGLTYSPRPITIGH